MQNVPEICVSICGAIALVTLALIPMALRMLRNAPEVGEPWP